MKIHDLQLESAKDRKRLGRGIGSGTGKTSGRGTKGQNARTGGGVRPGFEGGQNPLAKRLPKKRGFAAINPTLYQVVNLEKLATLSGDVTNDTLRAAGLVRHADRAIKLLGQGEFKTKLSVSTQAASKSAIAAIEAAGGTFTAVDLPRRVVKPSTRKVDA